MFRLPLLESFWDKPIFMGYALSSFAWWVDWIVIAIAVVLFGGLYFLLVWLLGRMKLSAEDKETLKNYKGLSREEKKATRKSAKGPLKRVLSWRRTRPWLIPVVSFVVIIALVAAPVLTTTWDVLMTTLSGSKVKTIDSQAALEAAAEAENNVVTIQEEGTVLLKNNGILPLDVNDEEQKKINIFGSCAYGLFYNNGGSGSFQTAGVVKSFPRTVTKLEEALVEEGFEINENLFNLVKNYYNGKKTSVAPSDYKIFCGYNTYGYSEVTPSGYGAKLDPRDYELPVSMYNTAFDALGGKTVLEDAKAFSDTALFAITRYGSEDHDSNYADLKLTNAEEAAINMLKENFDNVIILLNIPTVMESRFLDENAISAAIFMGHPGLTGTRAVAKILNGKVNPSGHLVDTWVYDVKSAQSYQNFGNDTTLSHTGASTGRFTNYLEGIYVGYRYYVTRAMVDDTFDYDEYVQYSFGHGLSYTTFDKSIVDFKVNDKDQKIEVTVEVKNTGTVAGKDAIQIYTHAPYYPGGIEKSYYSLSAFAKSNLIEPGKSETYKLEFTFREIASWDTSKGYYVTEHGEYEFSLRENVWDIAETAVEGRTNAKTHSFANDIEFKNSYQTGKKYENIFQDVEWGAGANKIEYLSRNDFAGTFKTTNQIDRSAVADKFPGGTSNQTQGQTFNFSDNQIEEPLPALEEDNALILSDLKDADWDDPNWDLLLDQLSIKDLQNLSDLGSFQTAKIANIGKKVGNDYDGPSSAYHSGTGHPSAVIVACSWNTEIAKVMGESIGREGASRGLTGWYAPGMNTHRSPFGGRNFEYYSEDPLIGGQMGGHTAIGALKYGVYTYGKHFLLNDQEQSRAGVFVWANEQSIREIYGRSFEIYVDLGGLGIMSSFNCVGSWWAGGNKALLTTLLREEWGFHGVVVTDYVSGGWMASNIGLRAGNDLWLNKSAYGAVQAYNQTPHDTTILLRRAAKNILYACAHSNNVWTEEDFAAVGIEDFNPATDTH